MNGLSGEDGDIECAQEFDLASGESGDSGGTGNSGEACADVIGECGEDDLAID